MPAEPNRMFKIVHDSKCPEFQADKQVCECAYAAVLSLTNSLNWLTGELVEALHRLENSTTPAEIPILAEPIRQRLLSQIFHEMDRVSKQMLLNFQAQVGDIKPADTPQKGRPQ
ncbi:MAG TPA: hypothetical protein VD994_17995 [Prosthecobacter sp.]|nr:hypothetical protein [Prosthecobacter sp.]